MLRYVDNAFGDGEIMIPQFMSSNMGKKSLVGTYVVKLIQS